MQSGKSVQEVLKHCHEKRILQLDKRLIPYLNSDVDTSTSDDATLSEAFSELEPDEEDKQVEALQSYMNCEASELINYQSYIEDKTPYATQHGIKGAEFPRVLVILDDEEGRAQKQFSYEKFFGVKSLSDTDKKNIREGKDDALSRTRRLFYVCCSRATKDLAIVFFTNHINEAKTLLEEEKLVDEDRVLTLEDIS